MVCPHCGDAVSKHTGFMKNGREERGCNEVRDLTVKGPNDIKLVEGVCGCTRFHQLGKTVTEYDDRGNLVSCISDTTFKTETQKLKGSRFTKKGTGKPKMQVRI